MQCTVCVASSSFLLLPSQSTIVNILGFRCVFLSTSCNYIEFEFFVNRCQNVVQPARDDFATILVPKSSLLHYYHFLLYNQPHIVLSPC